MDEEKDLFAEEEEESPPSYLRRLTLFKVLALVLAALVVRQLWTLQVVDGSQYRQFADENRLRITTVKAPRGVIYDRDGQLLVRNVPSYTVGIVPATLPDDRKEEIFRLLGDMLAMTVTQVE